MKAIVIAVVGTVVWSGVLIAGPASGGNTIFLYENPYSFRNGSEVTAVTAPMDYLSAYSPAAIVDGGFETFSVQARASFKPGVAYNFTLSDRDSQGRKLTKGAAFLYSEFASGTLEEFNYADPLARSEDAKELQAAIWYLQGRQKGGRFFPAGGSGNPYYDLAVDELGLKNIRTPNRGMFDVQILRLRGGRNAGHENQLVACGPGPVTAVPEPEITRIGLLGLGFAFVYFSRNRHSAPPR
jgi:hypothetical protein